MVNLDPELLIILILYGIFCIFSCTLSILFMKRYLRYRNPDLFYWGLSLIILTISVGLQNLIPNMLSIFTSPENFPYYLQLFLYGFYPLGAITFNKSITNLIIKNERKKKMVMILTIIAISILTLIYYIFYIISYDANFYLIRLYNPFYAIFASLFIIISLLLFCRQSLKSDLPTVKLKGSFQLLCVICVIFFILRYFVNTILFSYFAIIAYCLGIIFLYIGIVLPEPIKNFFLKGDNA